MKQDATYSVYEPFTKKCRESRLKVVGQYPTLRPLRAV